MTYEPKGIFHGTGEYDTGKTIWALGPYALKDTAYIYDDVKKFNVEGKNTDELKKEFGLFLDLTEKYPVHKFKELEFAQAVMAEIDNIPAAKYQSIVVDTWTRFGKALRRYAKANPLLFREKEAFTNQVAIRHAEEWGQASIVEKNYIAMLSHKSEALFLITHIKQKIKANVRTEAYEPDCGKAFETACNMRLWFRHNPNSGVPIALVLKRLAKIEFEDGRIKPVNLLPRKITPEKYDTSIWDCIDQYWDNPVGNREPTESEIPTSFELGILDSTLTESQKEMWEAELREKNRQEKEVQELFDNQYNEAKILVNKLAQSHNGLPKPAIALQIAKEIQEQYPDYNQSDIVEMMED